MHEFGVAATERVRACTPPSDRLEGEPVPSIDPQCRLSERPTAELRARSHELRQMALTASTEDIRAALLRLAARFDRLAEKLEADPQGKAER